MSTPTGEVYYAVFASGAKDAAQLTGWKRSKQKAIAAYNRSSHPKHGGRVMVGKVFIKPAKEAAA